MCSTPEWLRFLGFQCTLYRLVQEQLKDYFTHTKRQGAKRQIILSCFAKPAKEKSAFKSLALTKSPRHEIHQTRWLFRGTSIARGPQCMHYFYDMWWIKWLSSLYFAECLYKWYYCYKFTQSCRQTCFTDTTRGILWPSFSLRVNIGKHRQQKLPLQRK